MPVGGIKEKILAATRSGADTVILPHSNKSDFQDLPKYVIATYRYNFMFT